jgi:uncharacterized membrane protein
MNALKIARANTCVSYAALIVFIIIDLVLNTPAVRLASLVAIALFKLALLVPVVGIILGDTRAHAWLCFIVLIYFINGVLRASTPDQFWWGMIEIFLCVEVFISAMLYVKWKKNIA